MLGKKTIVHFVGSDAYRLSRERSFWKRLYWRTILHFCDMVLYVSPHLEGMVKRKGFVLPFPIATDQFRRPGLERITPDRDVLYYCPSGPVNESLYRLPWILEYAKSHPDEKITILGTRSHPARYQVDLPNVEVTASVEQTEMPLMYRRHRKLIRMTTEDGLPRMISEALLSGIEVEFNGLRIQEIPKERDPAVFASEFRKLLDNLHS